MVENYPKLSVVIPCFNEADNVTTVVNELQGIVKNHPYPIEIIVVDGNSNDGTPERLTTVFKDLDPDIFKLILLTERGGYGKDIMHALSQATGDILSWTHADLQTDIIDLIKAYELYLDKSQITPNLFVKGIRENRSLSENFFTKGMEIVTFLLLNVYLKDIYGQPKMFPRHFFTEYMLNQAPDDFALDIFVMYHVEAHGYTTYGLPVIFKPRLHGEAKGGGGGIKAKYNIIMKIFKCILRLRKKLKMQNK